MPTDFSSLEAEANGMDTAQDLAERSLALTASAKDNAYLARRLELQAEAEAMLAKCYATLAKLIS